MKRRCTRADGWRGRPRLDDFKHLDGDGGAEKIVLLGIESALNLLPGRGEGATVGLLKTGERSEALAGMLDEALAHFLSELAPTGHEGSGIQLVTRPKLVINDAGENVAELLEAAGPCPAQRSLRRIPSRRTLGGHLQQLIFESPHVDRQSARLLSPSKGLPQS